VNGTRDKLGVDGNDGIVRKRGLEHSSCTPTDFEFAEFFGGGFEYFPLRHSSLQLFSSIRLLAEEED
jgi:hypothetical protein